MHTWNELSTVAQVLLKYFQRMYEHEKALQLFDESLDFITVQDKVNFAAKLLLLFSSFWCFPSASYSDPSAYFRPIH